MRAFVPWSHQKVHRVNGLLVGRQCLRRFEFNVVGRAIIEGTYSSQIRIGERYEQDKPRTSFI